MTFESISKKVSWNEVSAIPPLSAATRHGKQKMRNEATKLLKTNNWTKKRTQKRTRKRTQEWTVPNPSINAPSVRRLPSGVCRLASAVWRLPADPGPLAALALAPCYTKSV